MRIRLYEMAPKAVGQTLRFDQFPVRLAISDDQLIWTERELEASVCELEDIGGQILIRSQHDACISINDTQVESGPLLPGDKLSVGQSVFRVSYERTAREHPPEVKVKISSDAHL